jgi:predicted transposase YdaD
MFECWLAINDKILSSSKEATHSYLKGLQTLDFSHFIISLKSISETEGCAKMIIKGRERKRNEKRSAEMNLWTKVHGSSETRWHRF